MENEKDGTPKRSHRLEGMRIKGSFHEGQWVIVVSFGTHEAYAADRDLGRAMEEAVLDVERQIGRS
jgi:hypothetical protein